jgi:hypothetical protein
MVDLSEITWKEFRAIGWWFVLSIVLGLGLGRYYPCTWWFHRTAIALADALAIAGILGLSIEFFATSFVIDKTARELAERLVGYKMPRKIQKRIGEIVNTKLVRDNYLKTYRLTHAPGGKVLVETTTTFDVTNHGDTAEPYTPAGDEERVFNPEFLYLWYSVGGKEYAFPREVLEARIKSKHKSPTTLQVSGDEVELAPVEPLGDNSRAICKVRWVLRVTVPEEFVELTEFRLATLGAQVYVEEIPEDLEFACIGSTRDSRTWTFDEPFLAGQSIKVWWLRRRTSEATG